MLFRQKLVCLVQFQGWKTFSNALYTTILLWPTSKCISKMNMIHLNNDGLRHNKTIESFSSSHSSNLRCMLLESWDVLFLSLKVKILSGREYCIEPREYRKINFHQYHLQIVYFFFIKLLIRWNFFLCPQFISFG